MKREINYTIGCIVLALAFWAPLILITIVTYGG